ncbi:hypothetical protein [Catenulispora rubra]|uniref:hypothetical protein n=1 Tax=Catenulispora rubra TaxID=280293 RepID=UPI0018924337|nr:hypothetical protein [Catenulispora rubra]
MTEHSDARRQVDLRHRLNDAAGDFIPASAPYDAIVGEARRRTRVRAIGGSALGVMALGAAVAVGVSSFAGGPAPSAAAGTAGTAGSQPAPVATTVELSGAATTPDADHYGKTVIAQGDFNGVHWTLTRDLNRRNGIAVPQPPGASGAAKGSEAFDDVYFTGPNALRDRAGAGGSTAPGNLSELLNHFRSSNPDIVSSIGTTNLGVGSMDDSRNKEKASPYGITFLNGIVSSKVARVQVVFDSGTTEDATLVAAPAGEDGRYFYLPFATSSWHGPSGKVVYYDAKGNVLKPHRDGFSSF